MFIFQVYWKEQLNVLRVHVLVIAMERASPPATGLARTISDQLLEAVSAAFRSPTSQSPSEEAPGSGGMPSRKSNRRGSPGSKAVNAHIRKSRSAQMKVDMDELSSGAALSRASSASLGLSFSFTGFTMPPEEMADSKPFSDDDIRKLHFPLPFHIYILFNPG